MEGPTTRIGDETGVIIIEPERDTKQQSEGISTSRLSRAYRRIVPLGRTE